MANTYAESFALLALGLVFIVFRVYARWAQVGPTNFQLDDYLMPLAGVVFAVEVSLAYLVGAKYDGLTNSYMTDDERAAIDPSSREYYNRIMGSKIQVAGWSLYTMVLWLIKFSLAVFYSRLTTGLTHLPTRVRTGYIILGVTYLAVALTIVLSCQPMHRFWQVSPDPGNTCQPARSMVYVLVVMIPNVLTDIYLMSIPLPLLWAVRIGTRRKISLMALFSGAIFVIMAAIIRAVIILTAGPNGAIEGSKWACRESFVSIVVSNLPIIQPLIRRGANKIGLSALFSSTGGPSSYGQGPSRRKGDYPLASTEGATTRGTMNGTLTGTGRDRKRDKARGLMTSHLTARGSDEEILVEGSGFGAKGGGGGGEIRVTHETVVEREEVGIEADAVGGSGSGNGNGHSMTQSVSGYEWDGERRG
ncbi:hypothetical protein BJY04DRAFT_211151 [Aspergillus karnatakaensis]|uniref:uncharacterized protein n=1 Tax=Aspergillus karnatakaensis TaxID=1810916 RepID=UPI003CCD51B5